MQLNISQNLINSSTSLSPSSGTQTLSIQNTTINVSSINNETTIQQTKKPLDSLAQLSTIPIDEDSVRAIYEFGHSITSENRCPDNGKNINLTIVVMSAPGNIQARTAIRQTWGSYGQQRNVNVLFIIGTTRDKELEKSIDDEVKLYGDIIRGKFYDSYSNLTLKTISTLEWMDKYCFNAKFLLKTDDDMFINIPRLLLFIDKHYNDKNIIYGRLAKKWQPIRNKKSKYYVSQGQFKPQHFPDFTTGPAYLLSNDIIGKLFNASLNQTYLKLEDVFTTGIVAQKIGIKRVHANEFLNKKISFSPCNVQHGISIHRVKYGEQFDLWKKLLDGKSKCN